LKVTLIISVAVAGAVGAAFYLGYLPSGGIEEPSVTVQDIGDWGEVTDDKIEIVHTLNVQNPNPVRAQVGEGTTLGIQLRLNGVRMGEVQKSGLDIREGNNSVAISSELQQDRVAEFWSKFINQDETIHAKISPKLEVNVGPGFAISTPPVRVSALTDSQPVSEALSQIGDEMEGTYSKKIETDEIADQYRPESGFGIVPSASVNAEYTVEDVEFEWGSVSPQETEVLINMRVHNAGDIPLPGVPDGLTVNIFMNDIMVFNTESEAISLKNIDRDSVLLPDETRTYTLVATADTQNIEKWITSYASQAEQSSVRGEVKFKFSLGDTSISIPEGGALAYECDFQTGIFEDDQRTDTTCGESGTIEIGGTRIEQDDSDDSPSKSVDPVARARADPTEGEAPLDVSLDASNSFDSDGEIEAFIWRFEPPKPPMRGENVDVTFRLGGNKEAKLTVVDDDGNTDTTSVNLNVESRFSNDDDGSGDETSPEPTERPTPTSTPTQTPTPTVTPTPTPEPEPPNAVATANPLSGEAPLNVEFDGSGSSDPDGTVEEYRWEIEGVTPGGPGESITRLFVRQGEYTATLTVMDEDGLTDKEQVTVNVESRFGSSDRQPIFAIASPVDVLLHPGFSAVLLPIGLVALLLQSKRKKQ
jgi:LEA14-like dessication related protein